MPDLVLVTCGASKRDEPMAAADLYTGTYYRLCLEYGLSLAGGGRNRVRILSAKHGLLPLDRITAPYEVTIGDPGAITPAALYQQAVRDGLIHARDVQVVGGKGYHRLAATVWPGAVHALAGHGGMGKQMAFMKSQRRSA